MSWGTPKIPNIIARTHETIQMFHKNKFRYFKWDVDWKYILVKFTGSTEHFNLMFNKGFNILFPDMLMISHDLFHNQIY